jgi:hypothetical protein
MNAPKVGRSYLRASLSAALAVLGALGAVAAGSVTANASTADTSTVVSAGVVHPTVISGFKASLSQYWRLSATGCLGFPASDTTDQMVHTSGPTGQYETPGGSWKKLGAISGNESDQACGTGGIKFSGTYTTPENYAHYRVVYAGTTGATSYAATTSSSVLAWRYSDRIIGFKVSPTVVNAGGKLTVSGTLQYYSAGWHTYSGQTMVVYLHPAGSKPKTWDLKAKVKTNSKGKFSITLKDSASGTWWAAFEGNNSNGVGHLSAGSPQDYVRLK